MPRALTEQRNSIPLPIKETTNQQKKPSVSLLVPHRFKLASPVAVMSEMPAIPLTSQLITTSTLETTSISQTNQPAETPLRRSNQALQPRPTTMLEQTTQSKPVEVTLTPQTEQTSLYSPQKQIKNARYDDEGNKVNNDGIITSGPDKGKKGVFNAGPSHVGGGDENGGGSSVAEGDDWSWKDEWKALQQERNGIQEKLFKATKNKNWGEVNKLKQQYNAINEKVEHARQQTFRELGMSEKQIRQSEREMREIVGEVEDIMLAKEEYERIKYTDIRRANQLKQQYGDDWDAMGE